MGKQSQRTKYEVTFTIETDQPEEELLVEEAVTAVIDEELASLSRGGTRCGLRFVDATNFNVRKVDE